MARLVSVFSCLLLLTSLFISACSDKESNAKRIPKEEAVPVTVGTAAQRDVPLQLNAIGNVEDYSTVEIKPQIEGKLEHAYFKEGDNVKVGDLLFTIDPRPFEASLKQAEANLAREIAQKKDAESDTRRYAELFKKGIVSEQEYAQRRTDLETLKATVKAQDAAVVNAKLQLDYASIRSSINGKLGRLMVNPGNIVQANQTILVVINQIKPVYVTFSLPEQRLMEVRKYMGPEGKLKVNAVITAADNSNTTVSGELSFLNNQVDMTTGTILLKAIFPNEDELLWPGKFVNVELTLTTLKNAVVIPSEAVLTGQEGEYVFVVSADSKAETRPVTLGTKVKQNVVITKGLKPGEKVVTTGQLALADGIKVEIKSSAPGSKENAS